MIQQLEPGELVIVILTRHSEEETFSSVLGMGKLDFDEINRIPPDQYEAIQELFENGSLMKYLAEPETELNMSDPAYFTLAMKDGDNRTTVYRVPVTDQDSGLIVAQLFSDLIPPDYRSKRHQSFAE